ncbi:MAG TPA: hypothetical protein VG455_16335 [Acidimicrobiales bacterium]|nr:hypothetical protein [Acidimicrobiales bacterium]
MGACETAHEWRPEGAGRTYVRYLCAECGALCVAPEAVEELALEVPPAWRPEPAAATGSRAETPRWASEAAASPSPAAG